jgi:hypothetical protein
MPKVCKKKLFAFLCKERATKKPIVSFDRVYQKTSIALGVSYTSVHRIMNGKRPYIDPKKELKFWTTLIIVLLKEQSTVYIHGKLRRPSQ